MSETSCPRTAIILAAGQGTRLMPYTKDKPKCMLTFDGYPLIFFQTAIFRYHGVDNIVVVTGYKAERIREYLGKSVTYIHNEKYEETSSMYSLWLARDIIQEGGCFVLNSDVLFHPEILRNLIKSEHPNALAMDFDATLDEEEMKVIVNGRRVVALSKSFSSADGENVGLLKFDPQGCKELFEVIEKEISQGNTTQMVPYAVNILAKKLFIEAVPVNDFPWIEIDFPSDYEKAVQDIFPAISKKIQLPKYFDLMGEASKRA